jgi:hypothetical protein
MRARYCASDLPITMTNGDVYAPAPFNNDGIKQKGTAVTDVFEITAPRTVDPAVWFRLTPPSDTVYVVLRRFHWGDCGVGHHLARPDHQRLRQRR